ncbi:hypothetical protein AVEN_163545-1, partial [Araneus ventricosus]
MNCENVTNLACETNFNLTCENVTILACENNSNLTCENVTNLACENSLNLTCENVTNLACENNPNLTCENVVNLACKKNANLPCAKIVDDAIVIYPSVGSFLKYEIKAKKQNKYPILKSILKCERNVEEGKKKKVRFSSLKYFNDGETKADEALKKERSGTTHCSDDDEEEGGIPNKWKGLQFPP